MTRDDVVYGACRCCGRRHLLSADGRVCVIETRIYSDGVPTGRFRLDRAAYCERVEARSAA